MRVAICVPTFRRPRSLRALLTAIQALESPAEDAIVKVVVVDNDPDASAGPLVESLRSGVKWPIEYVVEERRGIPCVRNKAVAAAGDVDFIAFIDDDEVPEPAWLAELVRVQRRTGADVVTGAVLPSFGDAPPGWAVKGGFFERPRYPTGRLMEYARTGNVLIASHVFPRDRPPFDEAFALSGGEDTHFFMRASQAGHRIVWADEAVVHEAVPPERLSIWWVLRREYRRGNTLSLCLRDLNDSWPRRLKRAGNGLVQLCAGGALVVLSIGRGRIALVHGLQRICLGAGLLSGLAGLRFDEYAVTHGQ